MSLAEIKKEVDALDVAERTELLQYVRAKYQRDDPEWRAELTRRVNEVKNGTYATKEDLEALHAKLIAEGR